MKILLFGKNGQLGWELQRALAPLGELIALDRDSGDLTRLEAIAQTIRSYAPDIIVNAAAYTAVDKAENESELAMLINAKAPAILAQEAAALDAWLVHYSTDYVFDGSGTAPWQETDKPAPINYYGKSKLSGEEAIQASGCKHLIFRTSWVYGAHGANFIKTILHLAREQEELSIVADQIGAPTGADLLADVSAHALCYAWQGAPVNGLYHVAPAGEISWHGYTDFVIRTAKGLGETLRTERIKPISSAEYVRPARRPHNSRLNTAKLKEFFSLHLPPWESGVTRMLKEILG